VSVADGPCDVPARVLAGRVARRQLSAVEALDAHLARIEACDGALNAVVSLDAERARAAAAGADAALARGEVAGPLHGVPMTLKDGHDVAGLRTTVGTEALDRIADEDGAVAARLRGAGAIIVGHTNVAPWLADFQSANAIFGRTSNPWDPQRTAGGSSGGAAAALAAGMTPLEVGSDLAGSLRLPPHFCGVYGLKTTERRVPLTGFLRSPGGGPRPVRIAASLGPMARDLGDLRLALSVIAGPDWRDGDVPPVPLGPLRRRGVSDLRLAFAPRLPETTVAASISREVERVAGQASGAGARVEQRLPHVDWLAQLEMFGDLVLTVTQVFSPELREPPTLAWYLEALDRRDRLVRAWQEFFADVDALILPSAMTNAFAHRESGGSVDVDGKTVSYSDHGRPLVFANVVGLPALTVPAGLDGDGMPIGVQIVGPLWSELRLLAVAGTLERAGILPGFRTPPGIAPAS
jgi:amidase